MTKEQIEALVDERIATRHVELAMAVNAFAKGLLGSMGISGHVAREVRAIAVELGTDGGLEALIDEIATAISATNPTHGDIFVIAEKPFPVAERRFIPFDVIQRYDPKCLSVADRETLRADLEAQHGFPIRERDLLMADMYCDDPRFGEVATCGASDHNAAAAAIAANVLATTGVPVDVVISDTDTGLDVGRTIIGSITIGASPVGATGGLTIYECMRVACAAEFARGNSARTPIVQCIPAARCRDRERIGLPRGYPGALDTSAEPFLKFRCAL